MSERDDETGELIFPPRERPLVLDDRGKCGCILQAAAWTAVDPQQGGSEGADPKPWEGFVLIPCEHHAWGHGLQPNQLYRLNVALDPAMFPHAQFNLERNPKFEAFKQVSDVRAEDVHKPNEKLSILDQSSGPVTLLAETAQEAHHGETDEQGTQRNPGQ